MTKDIFDNLPRITAGPMPVCTQPALAGHDIVALRPIPS
jgi:hypothetical protein